MVGYRTNVFLAPILLLTQVANGAPGYLTPPKPILDAALAPWWTNVTPTSPSPDGKWAIVVDRDGPPPLSALAKPYVNLAGSMIDTGATRSRTFTTRSASGLRIMNLATGALMPIGLPANAHVSDPKWSSDGRTLGFLVHEDNASWIFVADPTKGSSRRVGRRPLMPTLCTTWDWTANGNAIAAVFRPDGLKPMPTEPPVSPAPRLQLSDERKTSLRTYPSVLKTSYDETLLDYFANGQLATVSVPSGGLQEIGKPMPIESLDASPDGRAFRVTLLERPYSNIVPLSSFPEREIVVGANGKELTELRKQGLRIGAAGEDDEQAGQGAAANGRRGLAWGPDGSLVFLRNGNVDGKRVDRVMQWTYPFAKDSEKSIYDTEDTISSARFSPNGKTLFLTTTAPAAGGPVGGGRVGRGAGQRPGGPTAPAGSKLIAVRDGKAVVLKETRGEDREPSNLVSDPSGDVLISSDMNTAFLSGVQNYDDPAKQAPRPFLEKVSLLDGKRDRFWQSAEEKYETATILDPSASHLLLTRQSAVMVPQSFAVDLATKQETSHQEHRLRP